MATNKTKMFTYLLLTALNVIMLLIDSNKNHFWLIIVSIAIILNLYFALKYYTKYVIEKYEENKKNKTYDNSKWY